MNGISNANVFLPKDTSFWKGKSLTQVMGCGHVALLPAMRSLQVSAISSLLLHLCFFYLLSFTWSHSIETNSHKFCMKIGRM